ncbi:TPA: conjugal transfer protein [Streptococcus pyogenes]
MKKMNKKIGILIGTGLILSMGTMMKVLIKNRAKKLSDFEEDDFYFDFDTENAKDNVKKEEIFSLEDEYLEYELKTEEEKQEEFRGLSVEVMDFVLKEVILMSENVNAVKKDIDRISEAKALVKELENCKEEIIALWEHIEALSKIKEEVDRG